MHSLDLTPDILAAHGDLSPAARRLVESTDRFPDLLRPAESPRQYPQDFPAWALKMLYPMQAWPALVGREMIEEIDTAVSGITALVKQIPARIFDGDVPRIARYFNITPGRVATLLEPPDLVANMVARTDFLVSERGIQFLEVNMSARLGGWSLRFWEKFYRTRPALAAFLAEEGIEPRYRDPIRQVFRCVIRNAVRSGLAAQGEVNLALLVKSTEVSHTPEASLPVFRALYAETLAEQDAGLGGTVSFGAFPESFEIRKDKVYLKNGKRVHALYEFSSGPAPLEIFLAAKSGLVQLYNGPAQRFSGDKRCLALLSEHAASGRFDARERNLIERCVPWGRDVMPGPVEYQGERHDLATLLHGRREDFVIKKGWSFEGRDVLVGIATPQDEWDRTLDEALAAGGWLVQERVASRPYLFQAGEYGAEPHSVVWGAFCIDGAFGGGFLRMAPQGRGDGVINSARGATEGYIFEV